ncbi:hypothetical protein PC116_g31871 [Phytophthora cactorum]|nr:hypothetical protein PC116_g31871 [Phytophthora cactorum]
MRRLDILCGIGMPFEATSRLGQELCGEWQAWGTNNKDVPVRKIRDGYFEMRCIDCMSNIYLVLASYIAAGFLGIKSKEPLEQADCLGLPSWMTDHERQKLGIVKRLPSTSTASLILLEQDCMGLDDVIGRRLMEFFVNGEMSDSNGKSTSTFQSTFTGSLESPVAQHFDNVDIDANIAPLNIMTKTLQEIMRSLIPSFL